MIDTIKMSLQNPVIGANSFLECYLESIKLCPESFLFILLIYFYTSLQLLLQEPSQTLRKLGFLYCAKHRIRLYSRCIEKSLWKIKGPFFFQSSSEVITFYVTTQVNLVLLEDAFFYHI